MKDAFFRIHQGLDREGPGSPDDVAWVAETIGLTPNARICDAGCGPGGDILALLAAAPDGHVTAVDAHGPFIDEVHGRIGLHMRVTAYRGDMAKLKGPFDLIWCAGALYFLGIKQGLTAWRPCLSRGGHVAFTQPCFFVDHPSDAAHAFWDGHPTLGEAGIRSAVMAAGYDVVATRRLSDAAWEAYYTPLDARIAVLRPGADKDLSAELDLARAEADGWRAVKDETGYLCVIARPV